MPAIEGAASIISRAEAAAAELLAAMEKNAAEATGRSQKLLELRLKRVRDALHIALPWARVSLVTPSAETEADGESAPRVIARQIVQRSFPDVHKHASEIAKILEVLLMGPASVEQIAEETYLDPTTVRKSFIRITKKGGSSEKERTLYDEQGNYYVFESPGQGNGGGVCSLRKIKPKASAAD